MKKIIMLLLLAPSILAADKVYKWLDHQGMIHYSSAPPATINPDDIIVDAGGIRSYEKPVTTPVAAQTVSGTDTPPVDAHCKKLKNNLLILHNNHRVRISIGDGKFYELNDEEKQDKVAEINQLLLNSCS